MSKASNPSRRSKSATWIQIIFAAVGFAFGAVYAWQLTAKPLYDFREVSSWLFAGAVCAAVGYGIGWAISSLLEGVESRIRRK
jgi:uncharacterized membrane protein